MDYKTFCERFPSEHIREYLITEEEFARRFKEEFDRHGPIKMGMSDVVIAKLLSEKAITVKKKLLKKKWVLDLDRFDFKEYYERGVLKVMRDVVLRPLKSMAFQAQMASVAPCDITVSVKGELSVVENGEIKSVVIAEMDDSENVPFVESLIQDLKTVVSTESLELGELGSLMVVDDSLLFRVKKRASFRLLKGLCQQNSNEVIE